jgi:hypothetical protein
VWFTDEAIASWRAVPRATLGRQPHYSDLAISTALTLRAVFGLPLRQTAGLIGSILQLLALDLPVPSFFTPGPARPDAEVADRETWHEEAALVAQAAHQLGRDDRPDRRLYADRPRRR